MNPRHAFEKVGKSLGLEMASHEKVTETLILKTEIFDILARGYVAPRAVATVIGRKGPADIYDAVVGRRSRT